MTGANRCRSRPGGWWRQPAPVAADSMGPWLVNCYRLRVKVRVTSVAVAYVVTKRELVKYCTYISVGGLTDGNRDTYAS